MKNSPLTVLKKADSNRNEERGPVIRSILRKKLGK